MEFKKSFFTTYIVSILMFVLVVAAALYAKDLFMGVVALVLVGILVKWYVQYDEEEQDIDAWFNAMDKETKKKLYKEFNGNDQADDEEGVGEIVDEDHNN